MIDQFFSTLTYFDIAIIFIIFFSLFLGFTKGFLKSLINMITWVFCTAIIILYYSNIVDYLEHFISNTVIRYVFGIIGVYILLLIITNMIALKIIDLISNIRGGLADRLLGIFFGLIRGYIIACIMLWCVLVFNNAFLDKKQDKHWLYHSTTYPYLDEGREYLIQFMMPFLEEDNIIRKLSLEEQNTTKKKQITKEKSKNIFDILDK